MRTRYLTDKEFLVEAQENKFASGYRPDGYFGERCQCEFTLIDDMICIINPDQSVCGSGLPPVIDVREARWVLANHPHSKKYYHPVKIFPH